jgi:hypothetical protein
MKQTGQDLAEYAILLALIALIVFVAVTFLGSNMRVGVLSLLGMSTPTPAPMTPPLVASLDLLSEKQPDGSLKTSTALSLNTLGVGELALTTPTRLRLHGSGIVRLSITPDRAFMTLASLAVPTQNPGLESPTLHFTDTIRMHPIMEAALIGTGFDVTPNGVSQQPMLSDQATEWLWSIKPKQDGTQSFAVVVSIPVDVGNPEHTLSVPLKNIPVDVFVTYPIWQRAVGEAGTVLVPVIVAVIALIGLFFAPKVTNRARNRKVAKVGKPRENGERKPSEPDKQ